MNVPIRTGRGPGMAIRSWVGPEVSTMMWLPDSWTSAIPTAGTTSRRAERQTRREGSSCYGENLVAN